MKRPDLLIACIALAQDALLVTRKTKDFKKVAGLKLANWADDRSNPSPVLENAAELFALPRFPVVGFSLKHSVWGWRYQHSFLLMM
jgi:hypothetical protein